MSKGADVLERSCLPAGKILIRAGEETARAYVIQNGAIAAFTMENDQKIEVERFGAGTIIGEKYLIIDEPANLSFEVIETATVIVITRQDFQKKLTRAGKSIRLVLDHAVQKLIGYEKLERARTLEKQNICKEAQQLVSGLLLEFSEEQRPEYENTLLPHANGLMKALKKIKEDSK
ncbi:MAG: hypothetical protein COB14_01965 [Alphaproteobacteria bacterium]|nr:MAG: hypothetical protein COB14_01965 [Alphaproteobacteria bacterium]